MSVIEQIAIIVALVLANGFFAGSEIALVAVRTTRLRELAEEGRRGAKVARCDACACASPTKPRDDRSA